MIARHETFVQAAADGDDVKVMEHLRDGIPVDVENALRETALSQAIRNNRVTTVRLLLSSGADTSQPVGVQHEFAPLALAVAYATPEMVQVLLDGGARPNGPHRQRDRRTPIYQAALRGELEVVKLLLDHGVHVGSQGIHVRGARGNSTLPLWAAADRGHPKIVRLLLDHGAQATWDALSAAESHRRSTGEARYGQVITMLKEALTFDQ